MGPFFKSICDIRLFQNRQNNYKGDIVIYILLKSTCHIEAPSQCPPPPSVSAINSSQVCSLISRVADKVLICGTPPGDLLLHPSFFFCLNQEKAIR